MDEILSGRQNLEMFGRLYHLGSRQAARWAADPLDRFELSGTGRVIAEGSPAELKQQLGGDRLDLVLRGGSSLTEGGDRFSVRC